jgi:hypothetical protein
VRKPRPGLPCDIAASLVSHESFHDSFGAPVRCGTMNLRAGG